MQSFLIFPKLLIKCGIHNRKQRVVLNASFSGYSEIESGVPQGSVFGPLLFLIHINDLERNIKSNINFFADDTMLFSVVKDPVISADDLNPDPTKQATKVFLAKKVIHS